MYRNKEAFIDSLGDTFTEKGLFVQKDGKALHSLVDGYQITHSSKKKQLEKGNMIELHTPNT